jgi:L-threonylcarbamoyladenylate synthase
MDQGSDIQHAVEVLRAGGLVAFPTETVYGLGADAENATAVSQIFAAKGRPLGHPLIVHLGEVASLAAWARDVPHLAWRLAERFWPGPLTLILHRQGRIPDIVTGGLETVGLRVPSHPTARALLRAFGGGVAAPSANRFGRVSPTTAEDVREELGATVHYILTGGPCDVGLESTIVDLSSAAPAILRPGGVTREALEAVLEQPIPVRTGGSVRSPGQLASHYAPRARVVLVSPHTLRAQATALQAEGLRVAVLTPPEQPAGPPEVTTFALSAAPEEVARVLYATLREIDRQGFDAVLVCLPPEQGLGLAIADRLRRAAGPRHEQERANETRRMR